MTSRQRVLLTGATGQLGRALQRTLATRDVVALSHQALDVADLDAVRKAVAASLPDVLVNAAAYTKVDEAERDPRSAYRGNARGRGKAQPHPDIACAICAYAFLLRRVDRIR